MMKSVAALACALAISLPAVAQSGASAPAASPGGPDAATLARLRDRIRTDLKGLVSENLGLSEAEAQKFWPAYDKCRAEIDAAHRKINRTITDYVSTENRMTDAAAKKLMGDALGAEVEESRARKACFDRVAKVLPGKKAARYLQIETKIDALARFDAALVIPLVQ